MEVQGGLEYIMIYIASAAILVYMLATNLLVATNTHTPSILAQAGSSSCYISQVLDCVSVSASSATGNIVIVLINNGEVPLKLTPQSFGVRFRPFLGDFIGSCTPSIAAQNSAITCTVDVGTANLTSGEQINPTFTIGYQECAYGSCASEVSVAGTATLYSF